MRHFIVVVVVLGLILSSFIPASSAPASISLGGGKVVQESFTTPEIVKSWAVNDMYYGGKSGQVVSSWTSLYGKGAIRVDDLDGQPLPGTGLHAPLPHGIVSNRWTNVLDGVYEVRAKFASSDLGLGAFQVLVYFQKGESAYQATFHFRTGDWSDLPFPNKGGPGIYVYDHSDWPQLVGQLPNLNGKQWITVTGRIDTRSMKYLSVGIEDVNIKLEGFGPALSGNPFVGTDKNSGINLAVAGKLGAKTVWGAFTDVSLYPVIEGPSFGKVGDPLAWSAKPTPSEGNSLMKGGIYISEISGKVLASEWGCVHSSGKQAVPADGIWCFLSLPAEPDGTYKATWYPPKTGSYVVATTAWDTGGTQCSNNPYISLPWTSAGGLIYTDCGVAPTIVNVTERAVQAANYSQISKK